MAGLIPEFIELDLRPKPGFYNRCKRSLNIDFSKDPEGEIKICLRFSRNHNRWHSFILEGYSCYEGEGLINLKFKRADNGE